MVFSWNVVPQLTILKLARSGLSFANLFLVLFTISFTNILNNKKYFKIILFVPQAIVVLLVWLQPNVFAVEKIVAMFVNILIPPYLILSFVLSFIVLIKEFKKRYLVFFIGFCMLLFAIAIDSINYSAQIIPYTWYIILGYFSVIISIFFILAREQADVFHLSLDRAQELEEIKDKLEEKVVLRTAEIDKQREEIQVQAEVLQETNTSLKHINDQLNTKNIEIEHKNKEIIIKNQTLTSQKNNIISSLHYASRIQTAVLPHKDYIDNLFPNNFILYKPKDIVSGDFYFVKKINSHILIAVADCTGHGVPGAFMSMLGIALLNEIVIKADVNSTAKVLEELRSQLKLALGQIGKVGEQQDGMDISLVAINTQNNMLQFSGAYIPLWIFKKDDSIIEFKGDKMPIGIHPKDNEFFTTHNTEISKGDCLYMFTDGYSSQLASENNETFKIKRLRDLFSEIYHLRIDFQKDILETNFNGWKNHKEQTDDVLVLGVKV
jgi:serine phosphatase RsbU (regulator of sigma subunit)